MDKCNVILGFSFLRIPNFPVVSVVKLFFVRVGDGNIDSVRGMESLVTSQGGVLTRGEVKLSVCLCIADSMKIIISGCE